MSLISGKLRTKTSFSLEKAIFSENAKKLRTIEPIFFGKVKNIWASDQFYWFFKKKVCNLILGVPVSKNCRRGQYIEPYMNPMAEIKIGLIRVTCQKSSFYLKIGVLIEYSQYEKSMQY